MDDGWNRVDLGNPEARLDPLGYAPDQHTIYALWSGHGEPESLVTQDEDGSHRKVIAHDDFAGIGHLEWTAYPEQPFAVASASGKPEITILDPQLFAAKLYAKLSLIFKGEFVDFINFSQDGGKLLFDVRSDRDPGTYYLLDTRTLKLGKLFPLMPWIKPERMAERRPIRFKADDGQELDGFLTIPPGRGEHALPMVLMPHGGPYYVADDWYYDPEAQFLASRGYLVLQVNFRGSSGRGDDFERAGYRQWGGRIQQDLIDGVKWAIRQKYADPKRVCVYGASFGGYSALMAPIRTPGLFKCAIGYDGVYDLSMMYDKGDTRSVSSGRNYLHMVLGDNEAELDANSPDKHADKIKIPVFLIHGKDDKRAPFAQAEAMRDALQKAGNSPQWLVKAGEGHGFYDVQNNVERLNAIQAFLEKNIGKGASTQ
jgi:dipeptidyl aminopeptidase/acylaminoacyl peptidase